MKHPAGKKENMNGEKIDRIDKSTEQLLAEIKVLNENTEKLMQLCKKVDRDLKEERLMNRMCFSLIFRVGNLPDDKETLDAILKKETIFDSVLEDVTNQMFYNGNTPHYGE
jgi:hypothetical protein